VGPFVGSDLNNTMCNFLVFLLSFHGPFSSSQVEEISVSGEGTLDIVLGVWRDELFVQSCCKSFFNSSRFVQ
jgi:hypothetical protein